MKQMVIAFVFCCLCFIVNTQASYEEQSLPGDDSSLTSYDEQENEFQNSLDTLLQGQWADVDTFAWNNTKINATAYDFQNWKDTARIILADSIQHKIYVHPYLNYITSGFGPRHWLWHYGVDIKLHKGDSVRTAFDGLVRVIQYDRRGYGHVIVVRHSNGLETIYGHLSKVGVTLNQKIKAGDIIGLGGNTGHSTGSHLHFEMRYYGQPFDPCCIVDFDNGCLKNDTLILSKVNFAYVDEQKSTVWHMVKRGETLGHIARHYGTSVIKLCRLNHITGRTLLRPGRKVLIYTNKRVESAGLPTVPIPKKAKEIKESKEFSGYIHTHSKIFTNKG